jgi:hypothetical protein
MQVLIAQTKVLAVKSKHYDMCFHMMGCSRQYCHCRNIRSIIFIFMLCFTFLFYKFLFPTASL